MKGTTSVVNTAILFKPPNTMKESRAAMKPAEIAGAMPNAFSIEVAMALACTPGRNRPQEKMVTIAKSQANHLTPKPRSM